MDFTKKIDKSVYKKKDSERLKISYHIEDSDDSDENDIIYNTEVHYKVA